MPMMPAGKALIHFIYLCIYFSLIHFKGSCLWILSPATFCLDIFRLKALSSCSLRDMAGLIPIEKNEEAQAKLCLRREHS